MSCFDIWYIYMIRGYCGLNLVTSYIIVYPNMIYRLTDSGTPGCVQTKSCAAAKPHVTPFIFIEACPPLLLQKPAQLLAATEITSSRHLNPTWTMPTTRPDIHKILNSINLPVPTDKLIRCSSSGGFDDHSCPCLNSALMHPLYPTLL